MAATTLPPRTPPAGALTTIWTPPCGSAVFSSPGVLSATCFPPAWSQYWAGNAGYYSPAICPEGFKSGCSRTHSNQGPPLLEGETAVQCVASGFTCSTSWWSYAWSGSLSASARAMIQVRWQSSDLSVLETHPLTPGLRFVVPTSDTPLPPSLTPSSPSGGFGPQPTGPPDVNEEAISDGLSTGAKAGIGAGIGVAALLICIALIIFIRRHRSTRLTETTEIQVEVSDPKAAEKGVVPVTVTPHNRMPEIDSSPRDNLTPTELPTPPPANSPVWHDSARNSPVQYDTPAYSEFPEVVPQVAGTQTAAPQTAAELEALRARREALEVQRLRILQLQQIEEERAQLDQRISRLEGMEGRGSR